MSETKTMAEWEREAGIIYNRASGEQLKTSMTREQFFDHYHDLDPVGVNYDDRIAFLKANGYDLTRDNMVNAKLSDVITEDRPLEQQVQDLQDFSAPQLDKTTEATTDEQAAQ